MASQHVAVLTFPFFCHPMVMFNLVRNLAATAPEIQFSFINTAKSNNSLFSQNAHVQLSNIRAVNLDDGGSSDLHYDGFTFVKMFREKLAETIVSAERVTGKSVTCFIADAFFSSVVCKIAQRMSVPWASLFVLAPYALPAYLQIDFIKQLYTNSTEQGHLTEDLMFDVTPGMSPISYVDLDLQPVVEGDSHQWESTDPFLALFWSMMKTISQSSVFVMNSYEELNPPVLVNYLKSNLKGVLFLGGSTLSESSSKSSLCEEDDTGCLSWLDTQKPASVAYICFGTAVKLPAEELVALAEALKASEIPFLWALKDEMQNHLPDGFLNQTKLKGKIVSWAPQSKVLKHASIGVYVTHSGYNSALESIAGGVPMICRSGWADNHLTAKAIEELWKVGVRIEGGKFTKDGMIKCLNTIFQHEKGKEIRKNSDDLKQVLLQAAGPNGVAAQDLKTPLQIISGK